MDVDLDSTRSDFKNKDNLTANGDTDFYDLPPISETDVSEFDTFFT